jgi:outer membrane protein assembly factor BamB
MASGRGGDLFVSIPQTRGSVLALLDPDGRPRSRWPITVKNSTWCGLLLPVEDGSVRILCNGTDLPQPDNDVSDARAFAFDAGGRPIAGWPIELRPGPGTVVGDALVYVEQQILTDTYNDDTVSHEVWVTRIAANGAIRGGTRAPMVGDDEWWDIGPDGVAYGVELVSGLAKGSPEVSRLTAIDQSGERQGWPVSFNGIASGPAFRPDGQILLTVASSTRKTSRVLRFEPGGNAVAARSAELPLMTGEIVFDDGPYECGRPVPRPPIVAADGTAFVYSELDTAIFALDPTLTVLPGWPYRPSTALERPNPQSEHYGISCPSLALPAVGPDSTLYLALKARGDAVGGSLVAVGPNGKVRPGWPVELKHPGSEFWKVVVGADGTVYALAIEPESSKTSSATILAIAPDSTVLWTTTIIEP